MRKNIIFDLDLTLVDTTLAEPYRSKRDWNGAYSVLPQCTVYEGLDEIFDVIRKFGINTCIVSTSPRPYVERVVQQFNLPINHIVAYHDAKPIKPHPAPMLKALEMLGCDAKVLYPLGIELLIFNLLMQPVLKALHVSGAQRKGRAFALGIYSCYCKA